MKPFWQSKTVIGAVITLLAVFLGRYHVKIDTDALTSLIQQSIEVFGLALVIYGRFKATQPITFTGTKPGGPFNPNAEIRKSK